MKNFLSLTLIITCFTMSYSQNTTYEYVPGVIGYEAIAYNSNGIPLVSQQITLRASILRSSTTGLVEYQEIHSVSTNGDGYFMIMIGEGTWSAGDKSTIDAIPWGEYEFILKMEMDAAGGYNFGEVAADQFCSVPYSFRAAVSDSLSGVDKALLISTINGSGTCPCSLQDAYDNGARINTNNTNGSVFITNDPAVPTPINTNVPLHVIDNMGGSAGRFETGVNVTTLATLNVNNAGLGWTEFIWNSNTTNNVATSVVANSSNAHNIQSIKGSGTGSGIYSQNSGYDHAGLFENWRNDPTALSTLRAEVRPTASPTSRVAEFIHFVPNASADGLFLQMDGLGRGSVFFNNNISNNSNVIRALSTGTGNIIHSTSQGTAGSSGVFETSNSNNNSTTLFSSNNGLGITNYIASLNSANATDALFIRHSGVGRGASIVLGVPSNPSIGLYVNTRGTGQTAYFTNGQSTSNNNVLEVTQSGTGNVIRAHTNVAHPYLSGKHLVNLTVNNPFSYANIISGETNALATGLTIVKTNDVGIGGLFNILNNSNVSSALIGANYNTTGTQWNAGIGVHGASAGNGTALRGVTPSSGSGIGIETIGGWGINGGWAGYFWGNVRITGDLIVDGNKNAIIKDNQGNERVVFCEESPEVWFNDYGTNQLVSGSVTINIASDFLDIITPQNNNYLVFIQLEDECGYGVKVVNKTSTSFDVVALNQVTNCNAQFSYTIKAKRSGMENLRMPDLATSRQASENYLQATRPDLINKRTSIYNELDALLLENANHQNETPVEINIPETEETIPAQTVIIPATPSNNELIDIESIVNPE